MADDMDDIEDLLEAPYKNGGSGVHHNHDDNHRDHQPESHKTTNMGQEDDDDEQFINHDDASPPRDASKAESSSNDATDDLDQKHASSPSRKNNSSSHQTNESEPASISDTKGNGHESSSKSSRSSKKSRKGRSRSRSRSGSVEHRHKKRSKSRSRSRSRSKKSKRSRSRDRKRRSRSRDRRRSRSRSRSRSKRQRSKSRDSSDRRKNRGGRRSRTRSPRRAKSPALTPEERDQRTVFCMQLSARIRPRDLDEFFSAVGKVRDVRLITDPRTKRSKGIAYIEFRDVDSVPLAIALSGQRLLGVPIIVKLTQAEKNRQPYPPPYHIPANIPANGPMKLYVGSLHVDITEDMLRGIFEPFGTIDVISLAKDEQGRSKGFGFIQFSHAEEAKRAIEQLNNFELANKPIKVAPFTEKTNYDNSSSSTLDNDELDRAGLNLGASGKLALIAKLAEGSGIKLPQSTLDALNVANSGAMLGGSLTANPANVPSQCFLLTNMFDLEEEMTKEGWKNDLQEDVTEECVKYGGVVHIHVDENVREGHIYIKCPTIAVAMNAVNGLNGRYFAGKQIKATYVPLAIYHQKFPDAVACTQILRASS